MTIDRSSSASRDLTIHEAANRTTRIWRIVLQETAFETIAALDPRFGRLKDGVWVPNYSEIARQGGISKQHLANAVAGRDGAGEAVHAALLGIAVSYGLGPHLVWAKLFKLVRCDQGSDSMREPRRATRPLVRAQTTDVATTMQARARVRTWAREQRHLLGERGPIPTAVVEEYLEQRPEDREALRVAARAELDANSGVSQ